jgi:hypothetical protein
MLSDNWCEMADVLGRVANVSDVVRAPTILNNIHSNELLAGI